MPVIPAPEGVGWGEVVEASLGYMRPFLTRTRGGAPGPFCSTATGIALILQILYPH